MHIQSHIRAESGCDGCFGCFGHIQPKMVELQPSRVTSRVTSSQKWRTSSPPATFVRNRVLYVKFMPKFSARAARSLAMQIRKSHPESHPCKIQRPVTSEWSHPQSHPDKIQSLPGGHPTLRPHARILVTTARNPCTYCGGGSASIRAGRRPNWTAVTTAPPRSAAPRPCSSSSSAALHAIPLRGGGDDIFVSPHTPVAGPTARCRCAH